MFSLNQQKFLNTFCLESALILEHEPNYKPFARLIIRN